MTLKKLLVTASLAASPVLLIAQGRGLDPAKLLKPLADEWPTYSGDYSAKRYSLLTQINRLNVKHLTLAWTLRLTGGSVQRSWRRWIRRRPWRWRCNKFQHRRRGDRRLSGRRSSDDQSISADG